MAVGLGYQRTANGLFVPQLEETEPADVRTDWTLGGEDKKGSVLEADLSKGTPRPKPPSDEKLKEVEISDDELAAINARIREQQEAYKAASTKILDLAAKAGIKLTDSGRYYIQHTPELMKYIEEGVMLPKALLKKLQNIPSDDGEGEVVNKWFEDVEVSDESLKQENKGDTTVQKITGNENKEAEDGYKPFKAPVHVQKAAEAMFPKGGREALARQREQNT